MTKIDVIRNVNADIDGTDNARFVGYKMGKFIDNFPITGAEVLFMKYATREE